MSQTTITVSAQDLLGNFGVNTHAGLYDQDGYVNASLVIRSLDYLGINTVRDNFRTDGVPGQVLQAMADAGVKFDFVALNTVGANGSAGVQSFVNSVASFAATNPGSVIAIEGQNEVDLYGTSYAGDTSLAGAIKVQQQLYADVKANAALSGVSVYNMAMGRDANYAALGDLSAYSDFANAHFYAGAASNVASVFGASVAQASKVSPTEGYVVTETGFTTSTAAAGIAVNELAQAKMTLTDLLMAYAKGSAKSYVYQLLDTPSLANTIANSQAAEKSFGLFNADGTPKLAATALHNFTSLLDADGGGAVSGTVEVGGLGTDGHSLNVSKAGGGSDLLIWRDVSAWSTTTNAPVAVAAQQVTVTFSSVQAHVYVYNPLAGTGPIASYSNVSSITLPVSDTPLIVELGSDHPYTPALLAASDPTLTIDATSFVAQIDTLSKTSGIDAVKLTDGHTLEVASIATMNDIIQNYGHLLNKITGGYNFVLENVGSAHKIETLYDAAGKQVSTSTYTLAGTVPTALDIVYVAGGSDHYSYKNGIVIDQTRIAADGSRSSITSDNAGHATQRVDISATGVTTTWLYDAASGATTTKSVFNADKSGDAWHFGITGKSYVSDHAVYGPDNIMLSLTRLHADGSRDYYEQRNADGSILQDSYTATGVIAQEVRISASNGRATTTYDGAGRMIQDVSLTKVTTNWTYDTSGALTTKSVFNADKSGDVWNYGVTGKSYVADHAVYGPGNTMLSLTRLHSDGSRDYYEQRNTDGSMLQDFYTGAGVIAQEVRVGANGARATTTYDTAGRMIQDVSAAKATTNWTYDAAGTLTTKSMFNADKSGDVWHYGITGKTYAADHFVYGTNNTLISMTRLHADGSRDYYEQRNSDGSTVTDYYGASGILTQEIRLAADGARSTTSYDGAGRITQRQDVSTQVTTTWNYEAASGNLQAKTIAYADKSGMAWHYGISGKTYTSDQYVYSVGGGLYSVTRLHADGSRDYYEVHYSDGSTVFDYYTAAGIVSQETRIAADGGRTTFQYDGAGHITQRVDVTPANAITNWTFDAASGAVQTKTITYADKSGEVWHYGITGKTYASDHYVYGAANTFVSLSRLHSDGTLDYTEQRNADGSTEKDYYTAAGVVTQKVRVALDGGISTRAYDSAGHLMTQVDISAKSVITNWTFDPASGDIKTKTITYADKTSEVYHYGVTGQTYASDHYVLGADGSVQSLTRYHADGSLEYSELRYATGGKMVTNYDADGDKTLEAITAGNGAKSFHAYAEVSDHEVVTAKLLSYSSLGGNNLKLAAAPTVNLVDGSGHVIGSLATSQYSITNGVLTLDTHAIAGQLNAGQHAFIDVTYKVTDGSTVAPTSMYSIQIDGTSVTAPLNNTANLSAGAAAAVSTAAPETIYGDDNHNIIDGRGGVHMLIGGKGNDIYYVDDANTKVVELQGVTGGNDLVYSSVSYNLAATFVEELRLTGNANIDATGNSQDNTLRGNGGNNVINGLGGNDVLFGGGGNDMFVFNKAGQVRIGDFDAGDTLDLSAFMKAGKQPVITQTEAGALVTIDAGSSILLDGLAMSHLIKDAGGFHFG